MTKTHKPVKADFRQTTTGQLRPEDRLHRMNPSNQTIEFVGVVEAVTFIGKRADEVFSRGRIDLADGSDLVAYWISQWFVPIEEN